MLHQTSFFYKTRLNKPNHKHFANFFIVPQSSATTLTIDFMPYFAVLVTLSPKFDTESELLVRLSPISKFGILGSFGMCCWLNHDFISTTADLHSVIIIIPPITIL